MKYKLLIIALILITPSVLRAYTCGSVNNWHIDSTYSYILRYDVLQVDNMTYAYYFYIPTGAAFYSYQPVRLSGGSVYQWDGDTDALAASYPDCFDADTLASINANITAIDAGKVAEWTAQNGAITAGTLDDFKEYIVPAVIDEDNDGIDDSYDMDCPMHDLYWQDCLEGGFINTSYADASDWKDYVLWQTEPELWLALNLSNDDSDSDGWTDGFELIHGYDPDDAASKPPTGLGDAYPDQSYAWTINELLGVGLNGNLNELDSDSDGWSDGYELTNGTDPSDSSSTPAATDSYPDGDWITLDTDRDGVDNSSDSNPYSFDENDGYIYTSIGQDSNGNDILVSAGYAGDATDPNFFLNQDEDYAIAENVEDSYDGATGDYSFHQDDFTFNDTDHDTLLQKFNKLIPSFDSLRPTRQSNYVVNIPIPIPGNNDKTFRLSVVPDTSTAAGSSLETMRCLIRLFIAGLMTFVFIKNVWIVLRQY